MVEKEPRKRGNFRVLLGQNACRLPPAANRGAIMAYDDDRNEMLLFAHETYTWDGINWTLKFFGRLIPPPVIFAMMAYDTVRQVMVLFGGGIKRMKRGNGMARVGTSV